MARPTNRLTARTIVGCKEPGIYADGAGLYLRVTGTGAKQWTFLYQWNGKRRELGLGGINSVSLARAREKAAEARALVADGIDPYVQKRTRRSVPTFGYAADQFIEMRSEAVRSDKSLARYKRILGEKGYAAALREKPVNQIDTEDVLGVLKPLWGSKPETASLARGYIENVLNACKAKGYRSGENPAAWRGHLDHLLPARQKLSRGHHAAMPFTDVPAFVGELRQRYALAALGLELLILTAARSGEVLLAKWGEFDVEARVWTVPAQRMKAGREHRVPLTKRAITILEELGPGEPTDWLMPGQRPGRPLSNMAFEMLMRRMGQNTYTVHGMRSAFRDWAGEKTNFPREIAEAALAHTVGDAAELAYRRGDALEKRRKLMHSWELYCGSA